MQRSHITRDDDIDNYLPKSHPTLPTLARTSHTRDSLMVAMDWNPGMIRNVTHVFTKQMARYGMLKVIPSTYKKQLTAAERTAEGNIYMPGRDVIVASSQKSLRNQKKLKFKLESTMTGSEMAIIKSNIEQRLKEHRKRLSDVPLTFDRKKLPPALLYIDSKVFETFPETYLKDYKNPCWWDKQRSTLQCLPYFYIGGAPKCATTDMWNRLSGHPDVIRSLGKEAHWWSRGNHTEKDVYYFLGRNRRVFRTKGKDNPQYVARTRVAMDASACTFWHNFRSARILGNPSEGPPFLLSDIMRAAQPNAKFIFILRNPTERQYSEYLDIDDLWKGKIKSAVDFHARVENMIRLFDLCLQENTFRHCVAVNFTPRLHIGMYSVHLREWFQRFPRDQIYILRTDEWKKNVTKEMKSILEFLELPPITEDRMRFILHVENAGVRSSKDKEIGPMLPETKELLDEYFETFNEDLVNLLGDEKYSWKDSKQNTKT